MKSLRLTGFFATISAALLLAPGAALPDDALPDGTVVLAKTAPVALLVWDATPVVAALGRAHVSSAQELAKLESDAMTIAAQRAPSLANAASIQVRVVYALTDAVSPVYHQETFAGVERLLTVDAARADVLKDGPSFAKQLASGTVPSAVRVAILGKLPPPQ